ncbi:MAG: hypothetical protein MJZ81_07530 [Bacteroidales bacterium]|nr:hypothetical protein [Bacteroidales bacterium]
MGGSKGGGVKAESVVTPAVAKNIEADTEQAQANQTEARSRLRGIRSTYNRFQSDAGATNNKLG